MIIKGVLSAALCCLAMTAMAQNDDAILFSVDDMEIPVSEFRYIYEKNNRNDADYTQASLQEYLDLYVRFKLKVNRALELRLDTITALQEELAGYRQQLAKSYLSDKEVTQQLAREAYERMQKDLHVSHILFKVLSSAGEEDEQRAKEKAMRAYERLQAGASYEALAAELSEDTNSKDGGGDIGYVTAMLPDGFYNMENAIYALEEGGISEPVRTTLGYHIFRLNDIRPARGSVEASHILVRVKEDGSNAEAARQKVDMIYNNLQNGSEYEQLARSLSDDPRTANRGGFIGSVNINMYDPVFEEAVFSIPEDGGISEPVRTRLGWHIVKRLKKNKMGTFAEERPRLEAKLARTERIEIANDAMIQKIKENSGMKENIAVRDAVLADLGPEFLTLKWEVPQMEEVMLLSFDDGTEVTNIDLLRYFRSNTRKRMQAQHLHGQEEVARELYDAFVDEQCLAHEERQLDEKYPEFASLMREYEEGILLFEVTKIQVWDKANSDTAGLRAYHEAHRQDYLWPERAQVVHYTVEGGHPKATAKVRKWLVKGKKSPEEIVRKLNKKESVVSFQRKKYLQEDLESAGLQWTEGMVAGRPVLDGGMAEISHVEEIMPETPKKLSEARGYVIADYQDQLEKEWVEELRSMYEVTVYEDRLAAMIR